MRHSALTAVALTFGLVGLAGCAAVAAEQSVAEACLVLSDGMAGIQSELADAQNGLSEDGDLTGATEAMTTMQRELEDLAPKITNPEVTAALSDFRAGIRAFSEALAGTDDVEDLVSNDAFAQVAESIQSASTQFAELCS